MTWRQRGIVLIVLATASPLAAQQGPHAQRAHVERAAPVEGILQLRQSLELSDEQVAALESLRKQIEEHRDAQRASAQELRGDIRSGELGRNVIQERMEAHRDAAEAQQKEHQAQIEAVLNETQRARLEEIDEFARRGHAKHDGNRTFRSGRGGRQGMAPGRARMNRGGFGWGRQSRFRRGGIRPPP